MKEEVLARDFDLGFSGNSEDVVMHAIQLLGNCITITHTSKNDEFFITPSTTIPSVFELNFYSNGVLHVFIMEAIVGKSGPEVFSWPVKWPKACDGVCFSVGDRPLFQGMCCYRFSFEIKVSSAISLIIAYFYIYYSMSSNWTTVYIVLHDLPSRRSQMSCCRGAENLGEMRHACGCEVSGGNRREREQRGWKLLKKVWQGWDHMESQEVNSEGIYLNFSGEHR